MCYALTCWLNGLSMLKSSKILTLAMALFAVSSALLANAVVTQRFPVTIQVSVREPLVLTGPTPANGTLLASSNKNFTLSFKNTSGPVNSIVYFVTNGTGWNCPGCGVNGQPFTLAIAGTVVAPAQDGGGGSYCGNPIGDGRCSFTYIVPSGVSTLIATLTAGSNAPIVNFTMNFYLAR